MEIKGSSPTTLTVRWLDRVQSVWRLLGISPIGLLMLVVIGVAPLFIKNDYILRLMVVSLMFGTQAMAFDLTIGFINVVNFGFAAFVGLGAYTSGLLAVKLGLSPWIGLILGPLVAGLLGFLLGILTLRLRGIYAAIMAWFVGLALMGLVTVNVDLTRGPLGLVVPLFFESSDQILYFYIIFPIMIGTLVILRLLTRSHIGLAFRALGGNLDAARTSGINPVKYMVMNFTISCSLAGLVGVFYAHYFGILTPAMMHTRSTVEILAIAYIGGRGTLWGGLLAAFLVIPVFEYLRGLLAYRWIIYGLFLIVTMVFYPGGLVGVVLWIGNLIKRLLSRPSKGP
jgi:branched-chain amino acid transport system permease protein